MRSIASHARDELKGGTVVDESTMILMVALTALRATREPPTPNASLPHGSRLSRSREPSRTTTRFCGSSPGFDSKKRGPTFRRSSASMKREYETIMTRLRRGIDRDEGWEP